jgi:taurine dioxygenase
MRIERNEFGSSIRGVCADAMDRDQMRQVKEALYGSRLVILKDQSLTEKQFCDFAQAFGEPVPYLQTNYHHPDHPLIFVSSNVKSVGKPMGVARTGGYWHSDTAFEADPKFITMLMPKILPQLNPRATMFIDMAEVYKALPEATRRRLDGAQFIHSGRWRYKVRSEDNGKDIFEILKWVDEFAPPVRHPAVVSHPFTKEKIIYGTRGFTIGIADRTLDESESLLREIFDFAETDRFIRKVYWSLGDVIIWDNRFLAHCSDRQVGPEEETMMYRITLKDGYPLCASQMARKAAGKGRKSVAKVSP